MIYPLQKCHRFGNFLIFLICILLYLLNILILSSINYYELNVFFTGYFNDLLAPLLLFSYINLILSLNNKNVYSIKYLIIIIILCSFIWEYLIPFFKPTSVTDPIDVICYLTGTIIYWMIHKNWTQKNINKMVVTNNILNRDREV